MTKVMKGILSGLLSLAMCFSMTSPILAQEEEVNDTTENTTEEAVTEETEETTESEEVEEQVEEQTSTQEAKNDSAIYVKIQYVDDSDKDETFNTADYPDQVAQALDSDGDLDPYQFAKLMMPYDNYAVNSNYTEDDDVYVFTAYPINTETFYTYFKVLNADGNQIYSAGNYAVSGNLNDYADYSYPDELLSALADADIELQGDSFSIDEDTYFDGYIYEDDDQAYGVYCIDVYEKPATITIVYQTYNEGADYYTTQDTKTIDTPDDIEKAIQDNVSFDGNEQYLLTNYYYDDADEVYYAQYRKGTKASVTIVFKEWSSDDVISKEVDTNGVVYEDGTVDFECTYPDDYDCTLQLSATKDSDGNYSVTIFCYNMGDTRPVTAYYTYGGALIDTKTIQLRADNYEASDLKISDEYALSSLYISDDYNSANITLSKAASVETSTIDVNYIDWKTGETVKTETVDLTITVRWQIYYDFYIDSSITSGYDNSVAQEPVYNNGEYTADVYLWNTGDEKEATVKYTYLYKEMSEDKITVTYDDASTSIKNNAPEGYTVNNITCKNGIYYANVYKGTTTTNNVSVDVYSWSTQKKLGSVDVAQTVKDVEGNKSVLSTDLSTIYSTYGGNSCKYDEDDYYIYGSGDTATLPVQFLDMMTGKVIKTTEMTVQSYYAYGSTEAAEAFASEMPEGYEYDYCNIGAKSATVYVSSGNQETADVTIQIIDWSTDEIVKEVDSSMTIYHYGNYTSYNVAQSIYNLCEGYDSYEQEAVTVDENGKFVKKVYAYDYTDLKNIHVSYYDYDTNALIAKKSFDAIGASYYNAINKTYCPEGYITTSNLEYKNGEYIVYASHGSVKTYNATYYYVNWVTGEELYPSQQDTVSKREFETSSYINADTSLYFENYSYLSREFEEDGKYYVYTYFYRDGDYKNVTFTYVCDDETIKTETVKVTNPYGYSSKISEPDGYSRMNYTVDIDGNCTVTCEATTGSGSPSGSESAEGSPSYSDIYIASDSYKMAPGASQTLELINTGDKEIESVSWSANDSVTITKDASDPLKATLKVNSSATDGTFVSIAAKVKINGNTYTYTTSIVVVADSYKFKLNGLTSKTTAESKSNYSFTPVITDNATGKTVDLDDVNAKFYIVSVGDMTIKDAKGITLKAGEEVDANQIFTLTYDPADGTQKLVAGITYGDESGYTQGLHKTYTFTKAKTAVEEFDPDETTTVTAENGEKGVEVSWNAVTKATGYKLYRKIGTGSWKSLKTVSGTSYTDTDVTSGTTYSYRLKAVDENDTTSKNYTTTVSTIYLSAPVISSLTNETNYMKVKWGAVTGAESYNITVINADTNAEIKNYTAKSTATSYNLSVTSGIKAKVEVQAVNGNSVSVAGSKTALRLTNAGIFSIKTTDGQALIMWDAVASATSYTVYRKVSGDSSWTELATQDATSFDIQSYLDEEVTSGTTYLYVVQCICGNDKSALGTTGTTLAVPANVSLSLANASNGIKASWKAITGASKYYVTVTNTETGKIEVNSQETTDLSYTYTDAQPGVKYTFKVVTAIDSNISSGATKSLVYVDEADLQSVTNTKSGIHLEWNQSEGATKYTVYRKVSGASKWTALSKKETGTSYDDTTAEAGTKYIYAVRAYNESTSALWDSTGKTITRLTAPVISTLKNAASYMTVKWAAITGATSYKVTVINADTEEVLYTDTTTSTSYKAKNIDSGIKATVQVQAVDGDSISVAGSKTLMRLAQPEISSVKTVDGQSLVTWDAVGGATSYKVYRKVSGASTWTTLVEQDATNVELQAYLDEDIANGTTYIYSVRAYCGSLASTYNTKGYTVTIPANTTVTLANAAKGIKVSWKAVTDADKYYVTIVNTETGETVDNFQTTSLSYSFEEAQPGIKYTVKVESANGSNLSSGASKSLVYVDEADLQSVTNTATGIHLEWNQSEGATKYTVYRKVSGASSWTALSKKETGTSYDDTTAVAATEYIYAVRAYKGSTSALWDSTGKTITRLISPVISKVEINASGVKVTWKAVTGASSYTVKCSSGSERTLTGKTASFTGLISGKTYSFTVVANAKNGTSSCDSESKSITYLAPPALLSVTNAEDGLLVSWEAVDGATSYKVCRKIKGTSKWSAIATVEDPSEITITPSGGSITGSSTISYTDTSAESGTEYVYTIRAMNDSVTSYYDTTGIGTLCLATPEVKVDSGKIIINAVTGANLYVVYNVDENGSILSEEGTVKATTATSYKYAAGSGYYKVMAMAQDTYYSAFSTVVKI